MTDLFEEPEVPVVDSEKNYLEELVGEGKKFKTVQDLARGKYEADSMIEIFKRKQDQLRSDYEQLQQEYDARAKLEELVDQKLDQLKKPVTSNTPTANEGQKTLDPNMLEDLVSRKLSELKTSELREKNVQQVQEKLKERYGSNFTNVLQDKARELGLTKEQINSLAENTPRVLLNALGLNEAPKTDPFQTPPRSTMFQPTQGAKRRTWSYYQDMKKTNPEMYRDPKTAVQMEKDYLSLGADFEDGDFRRFGDSSFV